MKSSRRKPFFSIVVPTLNEEKYLPLLLSDLASQTFQDFEVIHVDGTSEDKTVAVAQKAATGLSYTLIKTPTRNVSHQRNLGIARAKGEWVVFMDADDRLPKFFLEDLVRQLDINPQCRIFTTWVSPDSNTNMANTIAHSINLIFETYKLLGKPAAYGALIGAHHTVTERIQFDESQKILEDVLFVQVANAAGFPYMLFRHPRYIYSYRRLRKEGTFKIVKQGALMNLHFIQGKTFENVDFGYVMRGGAYYQNKSTSLLQDFRKLLKSTSEKQLSQARRLLESLKELEL